ncbi:flp pilus-assembly TadE/G-like family protein [Kribbella sp. NBC_00382]|uniref:Rv3654c family TadE-like protein n=1 Tax=Kribbella sp. NBC_00382 TaxID=2975967 RepID=UPI002E1C838D
MADRTERGSATLLSLGIAAVLLAACAMGVLWAAVSVGHHRADAAADLAALSAAQAQQSNPYTACATAGRIVDAQGASLKYCQAEGDTITVAVAVRLHLGAFGTPMLTGEARAGPIEGADWPSDRGEDWPADG